MSIHKERNKKREGPLKAPTQSPLFNPNPIVSSLSFLNGLVAYFLQIHQLVPRRLP